MQSITRIFARNILGRSLIVAFVCALALYVLVQESPLLQIANAAPIVTVNPPSAHQAHLATTESYQQAIVDRTNFYRLQYSCPALVIASQLNDSAQGHSDDMANNDYFSHTGSDGSSPEQRIKAAGYNDVQWGENIAAGYSTAESVVDSWFNETPPNDSHRKNILNCQLGNVGVGYTYLANDTGTVNYNYYWVEDFGTLAATPTCSGKPTATSLVTPAAKAQMSAGKTMLDWSDNACAKTYNIVVNKSSKTGTAVGSKTGLTVSQFKTKALTTGKYFWRVAACNAAGCTQTAWQMFTVK